MDEAIFRRSQRIRAPSLGPAERFVSGAAAASAPCPFVELQSVPCCVAAVQNTGLEMKRPRRVRSCYWSLKRWEVLVDGLGVTLTGNSQSCRPLEAMHRSPKNKAAPTRLRHQLRAQAPTTCLCARRRPRWRHRPPGGKQPASLRPAPLRAMARDRLLKLPTRVLPVTPRGRTR